MYISVLIPTKNRSLKLGRTLQGLCSQSVSGRAFEVIVVDNGSDDQTSRTVLSYTNRFDHLKLLKESKPGAAAARNRGMQVSQGDVIVFLDDDVIPDDHWLEEHVKSHRQYPDAAVLGCVRFPWTGNESAFHSMLTHRPELLQSYQFPDSLNVPFLHFYTCNLSVPRSFLSKGEAFDEAFTGAGFEDIELGYRLCLAGCRIVFNPCASALHDFGLSFSQFATKRYRAGQALRYLIKKHPELQTAFLPEATAWRRKLSVLFGLLISPLAPWFDLPVRLSSFLLPVLGCFCYWNLEYHFWTGFKHDERAASLSGGK